MSPPHGGADRNLRVLIENRSVPHRLLTEARIETRSRASQGRPESVASSWRRGSKQSKSPIWKSAAPSRLLTEARIETRWSPPRAPAPHVASSRGRGSKLRGRSHRPQQGGSPP